jgi:hypothetical protein
MTINKLASVVALAAAGVVFGVGACSSPDPNSPQAACDAIHKNPTKQGGEDWMSARMAAGDTGPQMLGILTEAEKKCPDLKSIMQSMG